jgi:ABC-type transport system involved in multi-copper enzyme maturation permease subunit
VVHNGREVGDHPVLWREVRQMAFRSRTQLVVLSAVLLSLLGYLYWQVGMHEEGVHYSISVIGMIIVIGLASVATTAGISGERESRTWEALLTTPLTARQIIFGKFAGALRRQWFVPLLMIIHYTCAGIWWTFEKEGLKPVSCFALAVVLSGPVIALSGTGVLFSLVCRKSTMAALANFGLALGVWIVLPGVLGMTVAIASRGGSADGIFSVLGCLHPGAMMALAVDNGLRDTPKYNIFEFPDKGLFGWLSVVALYWLFYAGIGWGAIRWAAAILAERSGRAR